jgi:hypothetical protein
VFLTKPDDAANDKRSFREAFFASQAKMYVCAYVLMQIEGVHFFSAAFRLLLFAIVIASGVPNN